MKQIFFGTLILFSLSSLGQDVRVKKILVVNGGQFMNPADNANLQLVDPDGSNNQSVDTIQTGSVQDALVDGSRAYVAAQDSIVLYDLIAGERLATTAFGGPSTIHMGLTDNYLLVGNWYLPFGFVGPYPNNFRVFDRHTLAFIDSIPEISLPAKDFVVLGDDVYITQNFTTASFTDSAGYLIKVDLSTLTVVDTFEVNANDEDLGRLVVRDSVLYGINGTSNTITTFDLSTGMATTDTANADIAPRSYGSLISLDEQGVLYTVVNGSLGSYDLVNRAVISDTLVDAVITAFAHDTLNDQFYITQTDYFSYSQGGIYDDQGNKIGSFPTGSAPEVAEMVYNVLPVAENDLDSIDLSPIIQLAVLENDTDADSQGPLQLASELKTPPIHGTALVEEGWITYTVANGNGYTGFDSLEYVVLDDWGDSASAWVHIFVMPITAINVSESKSIQLYPNPVKESIHIQFEQPWTGTLELLDLQGRQIVKRKLQGSIFESFRMDDLPAGMYLIRGRNEQEFWNRSLIKQ